MNPAADLTQPWLDFLKNAQSAWAPPANPWTAAMSGHLPGAATAAPGLKPLLDLLQTAAQAASNGLQTPQQMVEELSKTLTPLMQQFLQSQQPWQTLWAAAAPPSSASGLFDGWLDGPLGKGLSFTNELAPLGAAREYLRQGQSHSAKLAQLPTRLAAFTEVMQGFPEKLQQRLQARIADLSAKNKTLDSVRAVLDLWIDAAEEAFAEIAHSKAYGKAQGELSNLLMELKIERQAGLDQALEFIGLPSRRELDTTHRRVTALRRENRELKSTLAALRADVDHLKQQAAVNRSRPTPPKTRSRGEKA